MRVEIGKMCEKGSGHLSIIGEDDHGVCGSHYYATVYIELHDDVHPYTVAEFEDRAAEAGRNLGERLNRLVALEWQAWKDEKGDA